MELFLSAQGGGVREADAGTIPVGISTKKKNERRRQNLTLWGGGQYREVDGPGQPPPSSRTYPVRLLAAGESGGRPFRGLERGGSSRVSAGKKVGYAERLGDLTPWWPLQGRVVLAYSKTTKKEVTLLAGRPRRRTSRQNFNKGQAPAGRGAG